MHSEHFVVFLTFDAINQITPFPVNNNSTIHKIYFKSFYPGSKFKYSKLCWSQIDHFWHMNIYIKHTHPLHCQRLIVFHETFKRKYIGDISFWTFTRKSFAENVGFIFIFLRKPNEPFVYICWICTTNWSDRYMRSNVKTKWNVLGIANLNGWWGPWYLFSILCYWE